MPHQEKMRIKQDKLSHERLLEVIHYNPETGIFTNRIDRRKARKGAKPGTAKSKRYIHICIDHIVYPAHRLAWFYVNRVWPADQIDHRNRVKNDNRISNIREATPYENSLNRSSEAEKRSGVNGIVWATLSKRWIVRYKGKHLCFADSVEDGVRFLQQAELGEFVKMPKRKQSNAADYHSGVEGIWWDKNGKHGNWRVDYNGKYLRHAENVEEGIEYQKQAELGAFVKPRRIGASEKSSGVKGITWNKNGKYWMVKVKRKYLGTRKSIQDAIKLKTLYENSLRGMND